MEIVLVMALVAAVALFLARPVLRGTGDELERELAEREALEAAKEAKYREIRDLEMDHRTGKVDDALFTAEDRRLRAEAVELLRRIDAVCGDAQSPG